MIKKITRTALSFCAVSLVATPLLADDTEIYVTEVDTARPNVLFILDTSVSMEEKVLVEEPPYNAETTYETECSDDSDRIYWVKGSSSVPSCKSTNYIEKDRFACKAALQDIEASGGMATLRTAAQLFEEEDRKVWEWIMPPFWGREVTIPGGWKWGELKRGRNDAWVECEEDAGEHGKTDDSSSKHIVEEEAGWGDSPVNGIWDNKSKYTFYSANFLNYYHTVGNKGQSIVMTRLEVVQDVANKLVDSISGINIGLMRFDNSQRYRGRQLDTYNSYNGGAVVLPIDKIEDNKKKFKDLMNSYYPDSSTPLAETLYEAALYFRGDEMYFGYGASPSTHPQAYQSKGKGGSKKNYYISPIEEACQKNHIVYLTDGEPQWDESADEKIRGLGTEYCAFVRDGQGMDGPGSDNCLDELSEFLATEDQNPDVDGVNKIHVHTVGFLTDQELLREAARKGEGTYVTADDYKELQKALTEIFTSIIQKSSLFTAPAIAVNSFNRLNHLDEVYFALFRPADGPAWSGNVKRYRFDSASRQLVDANGRPAVSDVTGFFSDNAKSFWSDETDGGDVLKGGAAHELSLDGRKVFTYTGDSANPINAALGSGDAHRLHEDNERITSAMLASSDDIEVDEQTRATLLKWARGVDVTDADGDGSTTDIRPRLGDPLHNRPLLVTYGTDDGVADLTLFMMTNDGFLHAIDTKDGSEHFAFMPQELLRNLEPLYENSASYGRKIYGLDGPMSVWAHDPDQDGIDADDGDFVHVYFGMRRGGTNYYALDVTDRSNPKLLWTIKGGQGDFAELALSWSKPIRTQIQVLENGEAVRKNVLLFAGGYDPRQDAATTRTADERGRAIFMVDAVTGALVWSGGPADTHDEYFPAMLYSIPADVRALDINGDGLLDQMFVGDMGGQIWRFDVSNGKGVADLVSGGVIARLGGTSAADNRRFYYAPDVGLQLDDQGPYFSISIGSGWRAHPLDSATQDRFYMIRDRNVFAAPAEYAAVTHEDLYNVTTEFFDGEDAEDKREALAEAKGWYFNLEKSRGEKALAESVTLNGQIAFTTYVPEQEGVNLCSTAAGAGSGRVYVVNIEDGTPGSGRDTRYDTLTRGGIPPSVTVLFPEMVDDDETDEGGDGDSDGGGEDGSEGGNSGETGGDGDNGNGGGGDGDTDGGTDGDGGAGGEGGSETGGSATCNGPALLVGAETGPCLETGDGIKRTFWRESRN